MPPLERLAEKLAELCSRAQRHDLLVALEPMAPWCLKTPRQAWEIVDASGAANAGVLIDAYHFYRGSNDFDELRTIPGHGIVGVQINDAASKTQGTAEQDCVDFRLVPGTGVVDVSRLLHTLQDMGVTDVPIGVEVMSSQLRGQSLGVIAQLVGDATRRFLTAVRADPRYSDHPTTSL